MSNIFDLFKQISQDKEKEAGGAEPIQWILVGLGNPGDKYFYTRHNSGFLTMDYISQKYGARVDRARFKALCGEAKIGGARVLLMKPQTMMNASGLAVAEAARFYKIPVDHILVISDDISLAVGRIRARAKGSDGGQRGLRSIITELGTDAFPRIKVGVGEKPNPDYDLGAWVLSEFTDPEKKVLFDCFPVICQGIEAILAGKFDEAQQICNGHGHDAPASPRKDAPQA